MNIRGSAIAGDGDVNLSAAGKVDIAAATSTSTEKHHKKVTESGFLSGGGFGISYGMRTTTTDQERDATTQSGQSRSLIGSTGGNLTITAGEALKVGGSDLNAAKDMSLSGKSVTIDPGKDAEKGKFELTRVQDGLTLAIGGTVVEAIQAIQTANKATQTKNSRVQALAAATAAMQAANIANNVAQNGVNVSISLTAGHSESKQTQTTASLTNYGSALTAGNNLSISATGAGKDSNIDIIGSDLNAKGDIKLKADNAVNLVAAQDTESQHSDSKSMSAAAGIGASIGTNGMSFGFTASASLGRGKEDGEGSTQLNSHVTAGKQLEITSGGDTTIKGAVASGQQVVANVGGDLKLESLQDTAKFDAKNQSMSVSGTVGMGASFSASINQSKIHSDYASVQEQSGIKAGDGGFQVKVGGNTDLKGAVISATAAGAATSILDTKTLTSSDIANHAVTKASSIGGGGTIGMAGSGGDGKGAGPGGVDLMKAGSSKVDTPIAVASNDKNNSTTRSGVGAGQLVIRDDAAQIAATGKSAAQTVAETNRQVETGVDTSGKIANNFDKKEVETELAVTEAFIKTAGPVAAKLVGKMGNEQMEAALRDQVAFTLKSEKAYAEGDTETAATYATKAIEAGEIASKWDDNGIYRQGLHVATQSLIGGAANGGTGAVGAAGGVIAGDQGQQLGKKFGEEEAEKQGLKGEARDKLVNAYQEAFATLGGALGGLVVTGATGESGSSVFNGAAQGANAAGTVDINNRQLHSGEIKLIREILAKEYASKHPGMTATQAAQLLESQLLRQVDEKAKAAGGWNQEASSYLNAYKNTHPSIIGYDQKGNPVPLFDVSSDYQRSDKMLFSENGVEGKGLTQMDRAVIDSLIKEYPHTPHCRSATCSMTEKIQAFGDGAWSIATGTGNAIRFIARGTGLMGTEEYGRWEQEGNAVQDFANKYRNDKDFAKEVDRAMGQALGKMYADNQDGWLKSFLLGRVTTGIFTGFGPAAFIGDTTRKAEEGHNVADSLLKGGILGK
ncbi:hemagglutinin repeat-containing protein [Massilia sp. BJB1822]|uniref:hemagglutinin repeat-containing protein n=1 Tax=Massilia sp. BJB1822 TaxID=2744470 RepID=UPI001592B254|nr:hemagglutinin repeat-containing protein [Massilia sp. BJB1822]NVE01676.1 hemagglutinin repeat-containing protein [Massilia sp. BJB1822]